MRLATVGVLILAGAVLSVLFASTGEGASPPTVLSYAEGTSPSTFSRTLTLTGSRLHKVHRVTLIGPYPETTEREADIALRSKATLIAVLPGEADEGEFQLRLFDRRGNQAWSGAVRVGLDTSPLTNIPATAIVGPIDASTLGGKSASEFVASSGGVVNGSLAFKDSTGATRASVGYSSSDASVGVTLFNGGGQERAALRLPLSDTASLYMRDSGGIVRTLLGWSGDPAAPRLSFMDGAGEESVFAGFGDGTPLVPDGSPVLSVGKKDSYPRCLLTIYPAGGIGIASDSFGTNSFFP